MKLSIALLAAGRSTRFGGGKLDAPFRGKPLGRRALDAALEIGTVAIVVGDPAPLFALEAAERGEAILLPNPRAEEGLGTSVARAADHAAGAGADALLLLLADMPFITPATLAELARQPPSAVRHAGGQPGIPACVPASWFPDLQALEGDRGASALLRARPVRLIDIAQDELRDIDTKVELEELARRARGAP